MIGSCPSRGEKKIFLNLQSQREGRYNSLPILNLFTSKSLIINQISPPMNSGFIEIIYGPMFSGKSSQLLRKIRRFQHARKRCLVVNYSHDNRYTSAEEMATHDRVTKKATKVTTLTPLLKNIKDYDVVGIDEGQFFPDVVEFCEEAANQGKIVVVAALDGTFERKAFGNIINLIPMAEKVTKLCAVCVYCTKEAAFTKRVVESRQIQLIGGAEMYKPVCRRCFFLEQHPQPVHVQTCSEEALEMNSSENLSLDMNPEKETVEEVSS